MGAYIYNKSNRKSDLTTGSMPMVEKNLWLILDDFFPMECMFSFEIRRVSVLSSSLLYLSTAKKVNTFNIKSKLLLLLKQPSLVTPLSFCWLAAWRNSYQEEHPGNLTILMSQHFSCNSISAKYIRDVELLIRRSQHPLKTL